MRGQFSRASMISLGVILGLCPYSIAQAQEAIDEFGFVPARPLTSPLHIQKALSTVRFESADFTDGDNKKPLRDFLKILQAKITVKGKEVQVVVDHDAFHSLNKDQADVTEEEIRLPPFPRKLLANTALRLALSQVACGEATYWLRRGQLVITTNQKVLSADFLDSEVNIRFKNRPLAGVLDELAELSGVSIIIDHRVRTKAQEQVTATFVGRGFSGGTKLRSAVQVLADAAELQSVAIGNVIYVTSPENAKTLKGPTSSALGYYATGFHQNERTLSSAIEDFAQCLVFNTRVQNETMLRINAKWINTVDWDVALCILTDMAGLRHVVIDDIVYVTTPSNAEKWMKKPGQKGPM